MVRIIRVRCSRQHDQPVPVPDHRRNFRIDCKSSSYPPLWINDQADIFIAQFNIIGAFKTIGILSIGWTVARKTPTVTDIGGMLLALGGTGLYAHAASKPAKP